MKTGNLFGENVAERDLSVLQRLRHELNALRHPARKPRFLEVPLHRLE
jgi:hypothetical protein